MKNMSRFSNYQVSFYGSGIEGAPDRIIDRGNNKEILGACILPQTLLDLHKLGINISDDQRNLLQKWRLLKISGSKLQTAFTILSNETSQRLKEFTKSITPEVVQKISPEIDDFLRALGDKYTPHAYILFFSYIMDGLVWDNFAKAGLIPDLTNKNKQDLWVGIVWGDFSPRPFFLGTNSYDIEGVYYRIVWNNDLLPRLKPLFYHPETIPQRVQGLNVPVIEERPGNKIYESSLKLSEKLAKEVLQYLNLPALVKEYKLIDEEQALIIVYHELMWDILEEVENKGIFTKPEVIAKPDKAKDHDIADLISVIDEKD